MNGVNRVILLGRVGKDPEVKYLEGGVAVAKFPLATSETYKGKDGNKVENTEWHNIVLWRGLAEVAEKYVRKGNLLYIEGKIKTRTYGEEGNKKYFTEIQGENMTMLGSKNEGGNTTSASSEKVMEAAISESQPADDLPF